MCSVAGDKPHFFTKKKKRNYKKIYISKKKKIIIKDSLHIFFFYIRLPADLFGLSRGKAHLFFFVFFCFLLRLFVCCWVVCRESTVSRFVLFVFLTRTAPRLHLSHFSLFLWLGGTRRTSSKLQTTARLPQKKKIREETTRTVETIKCQNICDSLPRASRVWREPSLFLLLLTLS